MEAAFGLSISANRGTCDHDADGVDIDIIDRRWENKVMLKYGGQIISRTAAAGSGRRARAAKPSVVGGET